MKTIRRARVLVGAPGWVFVGLVLAFNIGRLVPWPPRILDVVAIVFFPVAVLVLIWLVAAIVASFFIYRLSCPSCGEPFFESSQPPAFIAPPFKIMFITKCGHCSTPIQEARDGIA
jgi:hypothetical protein